MIAQTQLHFPMPIKTPRLLIRPPQVNDCSSVNAAIVESFEELHRFMPWAHEKPSVEETKAFIDLATANWIVKKNEDPYLPLFLFDKQTNTFIGSAGYHHMNWDIPCLETGYWVRTSYVNKGFITEAVNALTRYAFQQLQVKRIAISTNERSRRVPERLGFQLEGTLKNSRLTVDKQVSDTLVFARYDLDELPPLAISY